MDLFFLFRSSFCCREIGHAKSITALASVPDFPTHHTQHLKALYSYKCLNQQRLQVHQELMGWCDRNFEIKWDSSIALNALFV